MSLPPDRPIFLERTAYRRRRLEDAARLLPIFAVLAVLVPVWLLPVTVSGAGGMVWLFSLWLVIIVMSAIIHRLLARAPGQKAPPDEL